VLLNYPLTELLPFRGGTVEVEAALLALPGTNYLAATVKMLQDVSSLIAPPLGEVLNLAEKVSTGMEEIVGAANGQVHLPFHQTFVSAGGGGSHDLKPGYLAVILATAAQVSADRLSVKEDRLYYAAKPGDAPAPFQGYDYMLFRVEGRQERDDFRLRNIQEPLDKAVELLLQGKTAESDAYKLVALAAAYQSPDLAVSDRRRVVQAIKDELAEVQRAGLGAVGAERPDLNSVMQTRAKPVQWAAALPEITAEEVFGG
jgi:hypothetical protein